MKQKFKNIVVNSPLGKYAQEKGLFNMGKKDTGAETVENQLRRGGRARKMPQKYDSYEIKWE